MDNNNNTGAGTPAPTTPETPPAATPAATEGRLFAGKYKSVEDMEAGYKALETRLGAPAPETPPTTPETPPTPTPEEAKAELGAASIDFDALTKEFTEHGDLTPESREALAKAGYPQDMVDSYIAGQTAKAQAVANDIFSHSGGEENFKSLIEWGGANLSEGEISAFNAALDSSDINQTKLAIDGVRAKMSAAGANGEPSLMSGSTTTPAAAPTDGFKNQSEMSAAINKRSDTGRQLYGYDPEYTKMVEGKMARRTF